MYYHAIATLSGGRRKSIVNKSEEQMLTDYVIPFKRTGVIKARWGSATQSYQVLELRVVATKSAWYKASGIQELRSKLKAALDKNRHVLFSKSDE